MAEQYESRYFSGQGPVYIAERDANGRPKGLEFLGDLSSVDLTPSVDKETVTETVTGSSGIGAQFIKKVEYQFSMQMRSIKPTHLAIALQAGNTAKTAGTVTDEPQIGYKGKFIVLKHTKVSSVVVTNAAGSTTYAAGTDYIVDPDKGMIEVIAAGAITDAQDLLVDYSYAAQHHISAAPANKKYYLVFAGINRADDSKQTRCEIYQINLSPSSLAMIQEKTAEMPITGTVILDTLRPAGDQFFSWKTED
jgi:hypothetical protein